MFGMAMPLHLHVYLYFISYSLQLSTRVLQGGNHEDLERVMKDKERQQQVELEAAEAELEAEEAEQIKHVTKNANDDMTKALKTGQKDLLMQVRRVFNNR